MSSSQQIIDQTITWIHKVVVGCNFCPFAARTLQQHQVHYQVESSTNISICLDAFLKEISRLDKEPHIETSFLIFSNAFQQFDEYLDMTSQAEDLLEERGYVGIYQLASFHPMYRFASSVKNDAADYTNRSIYPMLHILRESSIDKAIKHYEKPENIPERNVNFARKKGLTFMKLLRDSCINS
ncbi:MAG: DUF1415 domain-containing protein [Rhabdochlamydiaceae bacterium]|nr:DUF1415 domain-containing protein [Rhabdochlamydiaceae bacterium]